MRTSRRPPEVTRQQFDTATREHGREMASLIAEVGAAIADGDGPRAVRAVRGAHRTLMVQRRLRGLTSKF